MIAANNSIVPSGRAPNGKFAPGNKIAKGGARFAKQAAALKRELMRSVTREDIKQIVESLKTEAKAGDVSAAKELFDRLLGKAPQALEIQSMIAEQEQADRNAWFHPLMDTGFRDWMNAAVADGIYTLKELSAREFMVGYTAYTVERRADGNDSQRSDLVEMYGVPELFDPDYADFLRRKAVGEDTPPVRVTFTNDWYGSKAASDAASKNNQTN